MTLLENHNGGKITWVCEIHKLLTELWNVMVYFNVEKNSIPM